MSEQAAGRDPRIASFQELYHAGTIDGVALVAADATVCSTCAEVSDRVYLPSRLPRLPVVDCVRPGGCRCRYEPSFTVYE